eukprot:368063_1
MKQRQISSWDSLIFLCLAKLLNSQIIQPCQYHNHSLPIPLSSYQVAHFQDLNRIYLYGGTTKNGINSLSIYRWDLSDNTWFYPSPINTETPSSIFKSSTNNVAVISNTAYFVGFQHSNKDYSTHIQIFDAVTESWINISNLTSPNYQGVEGCVVTNYTHIFMVGGYYVSPSDHKGNYLQKIQIYNIQNNSWSSVNINVGSANQYCQMKHNVIYVFGGSSLNDRRLSNFYKYENDKWSNLGTVPFGFCCGASAYFDSKILLIEGWTDSGGGTPSFDSNKTEIFDIQKNKVSHTFYMNASLRYLSSVVVNETLYIFGGYNSSEEASSTLVQICDLKIIHEPHRFHFDMVTIIYIACGFSLLMLCCMLIMVKHYAKKEKAEKMPLFLRPGVYDEANHILNSNSTSVNDSAMSYMLQK